MKEVFNTRITDTHENVNHIQKEWGKLLNFTTKNRFMLKIIILCAGFLSYKTIDVPTVKTNNTEEVKQQYSTVDGWVNYQGNYSQIKLMFRADENGNYVLDRSQLDGMNTRNERGQRPQRLNENHEMAVNNNMTHLVSTSSGTAYFNQYNSY